MIFNWSPHQLSIHNLSISLKFQIQASNYVDMPGKRNPLPPQYRYVALANNVLIYLFIGENTEVEMQSDQCGCEQNFFENGF